MWFRKKELRSEEFEQLNKKLISMVADVDFLMNKVAIIDKSVRSLRSSIMYHKKKGDEEEEETETNKYSAFLPN